MLYTLVEQRCRCSKAELEGIRFAVSRYGSVTEEGQMRAIGKKRRGKELISNVYGRYTQTTNTVYPEGSELVPIEPKSGREYGSPCIY